MSRTGDCIASVIYYGGWILFVAVAALTLGCIAYEAFIPAKWDLDDALWLLLPVGAIAGFHLARRLRWLLPAHVISVVAGAASAAYCFVKSSYYFTLPIAQRPGWDGLQERLTGLLMWWLGVVAACLATSGIAGVWLSGRHRTAGREDRCRT